MRHARLGLVLLWMTGCRSVLGIPDEVQLEQATLVVSSGGGETGVVGSSLPAPYIVTVEVADHTPVTGVMLEFVVTAGNGKLTAVKRTTDALGQASSSLTLGTTAGVNTVEVRAPEGTANSPATFTATGLAGSPTQLVLGSGDGQMATVGHALPAPFVAVVQDEFGNAVAGVSVHFAVTSSSGGTIDVADTATDTEGHAATTLTLSTAVGVNTVEARATGLGGSPVVFAAMGLADAPSHIEVTSGDAQSGIVGAPLGAPFVVTVLDAHSNGVPGVAIDFVVTSGNGNPRLPTQSVLTDAQGHAQMTLTLGFVPGVQKVEARATGVTGSPVTFSATASQIAFTPRIDFSTGTSLSVATGDVNGDGKGDLALTNNNAVSVLLNTTAMGAKAPSFAAKLEFGAGSFAYSVAFGDVNGDSKNDLAVANIQSSSISVLLNTTAIRATAPSFAAKLDFATGSRPSSVAFGDVNGDGKGDLAVVNSSMDTVSVLLNATAMGATAPSFVSKLEFGTGSSPSSVAFGDVNGDGRGDLAVANFDSTTVSVLLNTTAIGATAPSFAPKVDFGIGPESSSVAFGDVNGDGKSDLAITSETLSTVSVLLNTTAMGATAPSFAPKVDFGIGSGSSSVAFGDVNGDGTGDLAVANYSSATVSVLLNTTAMGATVPSFATKLDFGTGSNPKSVAFADVNGDGRNDLAVANFGSGTVSVLLNQ